MQIRDYNGEIDERDLDEIIDGVSADDEQRKIAERIVKEYNAARTIVPTHMVISRQGWYPRLTDQPEGWPATSLVIPLGDVDLTVDDVLADIIATHELATFYRTRDRERSAMKNAPRTPGSGSTSYSCGDCNAFVAGALIKCKACGCDPNYVAAGRVPYPHPETSRMGHTTKERRKRLRANHKKRNKITR